MAQPPAAQAAAPLEAHVELLRQAVLSHPSTQPFWEAAGRGVLLLPRCTGCGKHHWYPRPFCPFCQGTAIEQVPASGRGRLYACSALEREQPHNIVAYVELEEGPMLLTNLIDCTLDEAKIGAAVSVAFAPLASGHHLPVFRLRR